VKAGCCCAVVLTLTASDAAVVVERRPPAKHWVLRQYRKKIFSKETAARAGFRQHQQRPQLSS